MAVVPGSFDPLPGTPEHGFLVLWPTVDPSRTTFADLVEYESAVQARAWPAAIGILERCGATGADRARKFLAILEGRQHNPADWRAGVRERLRAQRSAEPRPPVMELWPGAAQQLWAVMPAAHEEARDALTLAHRAWGDGRPIAATTALGALRRMVEGGKVQEVAGRSGPAFRRTRSENPAPAAMSSQAARDRAAGAAWVRKMSRSDLFDLGDALVLGSFNWREWNLPAKPSAAFLDGADQARMDLE